MNRRKTLRDEGMTCAGMLFIGLSNTTLLPHDLRNKLVPFLVAAMVVCLAVHWYQKSRYSQQELEREEQDERNRMIQEKASWYSRQAEDWILIVLFAVFSLGLRRYEIAYTLLWFLTGRYLLSFGIRWWLNRKF